MRTRGCGAGTEVGQCLHDLALEQLRSAGCRQAVLWTEQHNARALAFYRRNGWQEMGAAHAREFAASTISEIQLRRSLADGAGRS